MSEQKPIKSQYLMPAAILVAGVIVAFAVYFSRPASDSQNYFSGNTASQNQNSGQSAGEFLSLKEGDFVLGNPAASVTIIEYGDFQCPFCGSFYKTTEKEIIEKYVKTGKAKFIWRDFAFLGEESFWAAEAARCAGEQGKFWQYHDKLFENQKGENQGAFSKDNLKRFASGLGLNAESFNACLDSGKYRAEVEQVTLDGQKAGVRSTPTTFINNQKVIGAEPFSVFRDIIE